jgi:hypothetical protein
VGTDYVNKLACRLGGPSRVRRVAQLVDLDDLLICLHVLVLVLTSTRSPNADA